MLVQVEKNMWEFLSVWRCNVHWIFAVLRKLLFMLRLDTRPILSKPENVMPKTGEI